MLVGKESRADRACDNERNAHQCTRKIVPYLRNDSEHTRHADVRNGWKADTGRDRTAGTTPTVAVGPRAIELLERA